MEKRNNPSAEQFIQSAREEIEQSLAAGKYQRAVNTLVNLTVYLVRFKDDHQAGAEHLRLWKLVGQALQDVEVEFELHPPRTRLLHRR